MKKFVFEDGYVCYVRGFSANELKWEIQKHGKLTSKTKSTAHKIGQCETAK